MCLCVLVVVGVDAELDERSVDDVVQCEDRIVSQSRVLLPAGSQDEIQQGLNEFNEILGRFHLQTRLVVLERANSLAVLFLCMTLSALTSLRDQWRTWQLRDIVESLFTFLSENTYRDDRTHQVRVIRIIWRLADYERCLEFFNPLQGDILLASIFR